MHVHFHCRDELCMVVSSFYSKLDQFKRYVKGGSQSTDEALTYVSVCVCAVCSVWM